MFGRDDRAVDDAPEVRLVEPTHVLEGRLHDSAVDGDARVVDPRVDAPEAFDRHLRDAPHVVLTPDIGDHVDGLAAARVYLFDEAAERLFRARGDDELRAATRRLARRHEPYAARRAGDYENLL